LPKIDEYRSRPRANRGRFHFVQHAASRLDSSVLDLARAATAVSHQRRKPFGLNMRRYAG
jgi:hypothetical protein